MKRLLMDDVRAGKAELEKFCSSVFDCLGMPADQAGDSARILVAADASGIGSHGVARLRRYVEGIKSGIMAPATTAVCVHRTPMSFVLDARGGIGLSISRKAMDEVIGLAEKQGAAFASVRDSNHFGIAGYYARMALGKDMIGIAMTNTAALGVPTFGREAMIGTNPIAVAVPADREAPFILDMATTVVTRGKIETCAREKHSLPEGWAVGTTGHSTRDPESLLMDMLYRKGGGILPLGGEGELFGGHKGFGLGVLVDIFTAVTSAGVFGKSVMDSEATSARVCHFFGALRIDLFRDVAAFKADMDRMLSDLRQAVRKEGEEEVLYAGLKEYRHERECDLYGIPIPGKVWDQLASIALELGLALPETLSSRAVPGIGPGLRPGGDVMPIPGSGSGTGTGPGADVMPIPGSGSGTGPGPGAGALPETGALPGTGPGAGTVSGTGAGLFPEEPQ